MKQLSILMFFLLITITITAVTNTWNGSVSTVWNTNGNWNQGHYPILAEDVVIPVTMSGRYPVVTGTYSCNSVTMEIGTSLEIGNGTLNITGGLTSQGNLKLTNELANLYVQDMAFNSGATITIPYSGANLYISDDVSFNAGSNINPAYGNFRFSGASPSITTNVSTSIYNLISNSTNLRHVAGVGNLTIKGSLTVSSSFSYVGLADAETLIYGTVFVGTGGTLQFNAGMVVLKGNNTTLTTRSGNYFNHLFINKTAGYGVTLNSNIDVNGNLTIYYNSSLTAGVYDITLGGNWTNWGGTNGYIAYAADNAFVIFDGAVNQTINDSEFFDWMVLNKSGGVLIIEEGVTIECYYYDWTAGAMTVNGYFNVLNMNDNGIYGTLNVYGTMELHQSPGNTVHIYGAVYVYGVLNIYGGISPSAGYQDAGLLIYGGTVDFKNMGLTMQNNFYCDIDSGRLRMAGNLTIANAPPFYQSGGTIELYGSNNSVISCAVGTVFNELVINKDPGVRVHAISSLNMDSNLKIQSGILTGYNSVFRVAGDFNVSGLGSLETDDAVLYMNGTSYQFITGNAHFGTLLLNNSGMFVYLNTSNFSCDSYSWMDGHLDFAYSTFTAYDLADPGIYGGFSVHNDSVVNLYQDISSSINCSGYMRISTNSTVNIFGGNGPAQFSGTLSISDGILDIRNGINFTNTLSEQISGGMIRVKSYVTVATPGLDLSGCMLEINNENSCSLYMIPGTSLGSLVINSDSWVSLASNVRLTGALTIQSGTLFGDDILRVGQDIDIYGSLFVEGSLELDWGDLTVHNGGLISVCGTESDPAVVLSAYPALSWYGFTVESGGSIQSEYANYYYMDANGINIEAGAQVSLIQSFHHCTFSIGEAGGTLLKINNNQDLTLFDVTFPENTWSGAYNVSKTNNLGSLHFVLYMGAFGGLTYEQDPLGRINWSQMQIPAVQNLIITNAGYTGSIQYVRLDWDYPIAEAQFVIYQSVTSPYANFTVIGTTTSNFAEFAVLASDLKRFYKVTAILEP